MGVRTGRPRGRPAGAKNKITREREQAMREAAEKLADVLPGAFQGDAHAFLMTVYKDPQMPIERRIDAAKAAVGYEKPKLAAVSQSGEDGGPMTVTFRLDNASREDD
jgi:hypothetical protein